MCWKQFFVTWTLGLKSSVVCSFLQRSLLEAVCQGSCLSILRPAHYVEGQEGRVEKEKHVEVYLRQVNEDSWNLPAHPSHLLSAAESRFQPKPT